MTTGELRSAFLLEGLFVPGRVSMVYCDADRAIVGGAVPLGEALPLEATKKEMSAAYFTERREVGIVNVGGPGTVQAGESRYPLAARDILYFVSFPAHAPYPVALIPRAEAESARLGSPAGANARTIRRYIHAAGAKSCQLVMGITELEEGSVWNTMPPHTHVRRTEVYMYFGLPKDALAMHVMGKPDETRSLVVRDREAVLSPSWSIHAAAGTQNYAFVWAMGGENQEFGDMDPVNMQELK
jgi:4-deoxy-L-threo-5-hexosulose-uronate ketol-isomerase